MFPCPGLLYEGADKGTLLISCSWKEHKWPESPVTALPVRLGNHLNIAGCFRKEREMLTACSQSMDQHIILQIRWERSWAVIEVWWDFLHAAQTPLERGARCSMGATTTFGGCLCLWRTCVGGRTNLRDNAKPVLSLCVHPAAKPQSEPFSVLSVLARWGQRSQFSQLLFADLLWRKETVIVDTNTTSGGRTSCWQPGPSEPMARDLPSPLCTAGSLLMKHEKITSPLGKSRFCPPRPS